MRSSRTCTRTAVRWAVEALANLARSGATFDSATLDTLRQKAVQGDENVYVRVKAAEALSSIHP